MQQLLTPGQSKPLDLRTADGALVLTVQVDRHHEGVSITALHHSALDRTFTNDRLDEGRTYLQFLYDEARKGTQVFLIEAQAGALTSAAAVLDQAEQDMVDGIRANMDAMQPKPVDVSDIVQGDGYQAERKKAREQAARFATRSQVHLQPPTEAELGRIRAHVHGIVTCAPGQNWTLLRAIVRRNLGDIHEVHGRHVIASVRLNARGLQLAGEQIGAAA